jgi:hypothetical protein
VTEKITYKYKWRFMPLAWLLVFTPLCVVLGVISVLRQGWTDGSGFLLISLSFVFAMGWILLMAVSDVVVDDVQISRVAFGVTLRAIAWRAMKRISCFTSINPEDGKRVRQFVFVSEKGAGDFFSRRIIFQERLIGMSDLLEKIKFCANEHNVQIVDKTYEQRGLNG